MARTISNAYGFGDTRLLSPPCKVRWGPWESTTVLMHQAGWEFAVDMDPYRKHYNVLMRNRETGMAGRGRAYVAELMGSAARYSSARMFADPFHGEPMRSDPWIIVEHMAPSDRYPIFMPEQYVRFDPSPEVFIGSMQEVRSKTVDELGIFRKWAPKAGEIIVEPQTVAEMLEKIKQMQSSELAEIRERNRKRELREQQVEQVVAQIVTLAA